MSSLYSVRFRSLPSSFASGLASARASLIASVSSLAEQQSNLCIRGILAQAELANEAPDDLTRGSHNRNLKYGAGGAVIVLVGEPTLDRERVRIKFPIRSW